MRAHLRRRHVAGIDRRVAGSEHRQERGLRPLEMEGHLAVAVDAHVADKLVPILARILAEFVLRLALQQVEGALHVLGSERHAVMPLDAGTQLESERGVGLVPGPAGRQFRPDGVEARLRDVLVVDDEVIENAHGGNVDRERRFLVNGETGRRLAVIELQDAAVFGLRCLRGRDRQAGENCRCQSGIFCCHWILPRMRGRTRHGWRQPISCL